MAAVSTSEDKHGLSRSGSGGRSKSRDGRPQRSPSTSSATSNSRRNKVMEEMFRSGVEIGPEKFASKVFVRSNSGGSSQNGATSPSVVTVAESDADIDGACSSSSHDSEADERALARRKHRHQSHSSKGITKSPKPSLLKRSSSRDKTSGHTTTEEMSDDAMDVAVRARSGSKGRKHRDERGQQSPTKTEHDSTKDTPRTTARKVVRKDEADIDDADAKKARPVRIRYEQAGRGVGGGKREISHASLGKLVARLTDAQKYDTEFRDVFLLTYRCFCSPYDFIKKLMKRYTAVLTLCGGLDAETLKETQLLLEQIAQEEENDRSSTCTSISTARSDINTGMEASVSIMRVLSVLKYWIKESGFIEMDLLTDRRAQKKLMAFLAEIQSTSPVKSIRQHAEGMLLGVAQIVRHQQQKEQQQKEQQLKEQQSKEQATAVAASNVAAASGQVGSPIISAISPASPPPSLGSPPLPPPPPLSASSSVSSVTETGSSMGGESPLQNRSERSTESILSSAMSKLKLTRSSSDPKREKSMVKLKTKVNSTDIFQLRNRPTEDSTIKRSTSTGQTTGSSAPAIKRNVTTGSAETDAQRNTGNTGNTGNNGNAGWEDVIQDTLHRARLTAASQRSSRTSYDNVEPLSGVSAQEMADQLTLMEAESYFTKISPRELTNKAWTRENKHKEAPHVMALIELFDATAEWVSSEILHPQLQAVERAKIIMLFIDAADNCYQMNNFNTLFEITTGLTAPCIRTLNTTWGLVSAYALEKYQCLQQICSPDDNYRNYRQAYALAEGQPRLPCWFILVKDLFTFEEAMKSIEDGLVNWSKFRKIYKVINEALDRQNMNYLPSDGSGSTGISRKGKGALRHDRKLQVYIRHRLDTIRKDSSVLYQLARNANTQESILFVNSLSEAGFL
ncbi:TPA: hypothetical protein N0F65_001426 [Lagenidium giganteum]|uniref:Ras-GEF domain-containing protein n=1 Tax=Lagenidium giganteum TaxID=4803 RepID=A0AAV2Z1Z0_9STRA|nr:TPA: hypothetical protein N0F65_001426 [Lagenidium giganteum]